VSPLLSRIVVVVVLLPGVLGLVWLGGWWLWALIAVATLLALHEYYTLTRPLRPLVLAGFAGAIATLVGAQLGGAEWMLAGFLTTTALAFVVQGLAGGRTAATVGIGTTVLGVVWIAVGAGHLLLVRDLEDHGRLAAFTVLIAVFVADTVAYFAGRLIGRHKLAPVLSPGKTWEGFLAGSAAAVFVTFVAVYREGFVDGWRSLVLGAVLAVAGALGDLFESLVKRDMQVKDSGRLLAGHGGMLDRVDSHLFSVVAGYYAILALGGSP
jgi:phosphatidate cytidylyltransferase